MINDSGRAGTQSTLDILAKLEVKRASITTRLATIDEPNTRLRCEALVSMFDEMYLAIRKAIAPLEQAKGVAKGLELAVPMILQHVEIQKNKFADSGDPEQLKQLVAVINACSSSVADAAVVNSRELARKGGRFDGMTNAAMSILDKLSSTFAALQRAAEKEAAIADDTEKENELDQAFEERAAARVKETKPRRKTKK